MASAVREHALNLTMLVTGLSLVTALCHHALVLAAARSSSSSPPASDGGDRQLRVVVPFVVLRDATGPEGGDGERKPIGRVLQSSLLGYQMEASLALGGLSLMLERALSSEEAFLRMGREIQASARLSTKIQDRIRRSAVCLEEDEQMLRRLIGTFDYVLALPDRGMVQEQEADEAWKTTTAAEFSAEGEARAPSAVLSRRQVSPSHSTHQAPRTTLFTTVGPRMNGRRTAGHDLHSYDSASQVVAHIVRDWTTIGRPIRRSLYDWCCLRVDDFVSTSRRSEGTDPYASSSSSSSGASILVPGAGMGRLAYDLFQRGHNVEANELSPAMAAAASAVLQRNVVGVLHPYVLDPMANEVDSDRRYDAVRFPDVELYPTSGRWRTAGQGTLSYTVGDFVGGSGDSYYRMRSGQFDAVVTCFFIDTASNPYEYVDMIDSSLKPGVGVWINVGPVQWHQQAQLQPSVDELRDLLLAQGWSIKLWSIDRTPVSYRESEDYFVRTTNYHGYRPLRFVAIRSSGHD